MRCVVGVSSALNDLDGLEGVQARTSQVALLQEVCQGVFVDDRPAGGVDKKRAPLHASEHFAVEKVVGFTSQRQLQGEEIGPLKELGEFDHFHAELLRLWMRAGHRSSGGDHRHAERAGATRHRLSTGAEADDAQGLAVASRGSWRASALARR